MLHKEILTEEQIRSLPLLKSFSKDFGLVGGTAVALHIGHRRSIDFDLFTDKEFKNSSIRKMIQKNFKIDNVIVDKLDEFSIIIKGVKFTFFHYPYKLSFSKKFNDIIKLPDLLTLAAMKAYTLGRRAKWKDYVDLYFIIKKHFSVSKISKKGEEIFGNEFNEKLFRSRLVYFKDIDYGEEIDYLKGFKVDNKIIQKELINFSIN
ncbi:hypothetical protein COZ81_02340 [Candidatus Jorgensenbacteria bacterium CG_4_8_14_3_um_filter_38_10]|nr:MAG: hypothetical protein COZ81_02340 [Candidatus Jorgensenbacteria bacterium CG_4_8_14_3_um_filter_38_10]